MPNLDELRVQATKHRIDWNKDHAWADWKKFVGPNVRAIWFTLTDDQKAAIAADAYEFALREVEE